LALTQNEPGSTCPILAPEKVSLDIDLSLAHRLAILLDASEQIGK
jgi:hypothetical protein